MFSRDEQPALPELPKRKHQQRSFVGDDGKRFRWDEEEQDWVQVMKGEAFDDDEDEEDEEDEEEAASKKKKRKTNAEPAEESKDASEVAAEETGSVAKKKAARKKKGWDHRAAKTWVYVEGLPRDVSAAELREHFSKVGVIANDPETALPKVKIYCDPNGDPKGDASICFANARLSAYPTDWSDFRNSTFGVLRAGVDLVSGQRGTIENVLESLRRPVLECV